MSWDEGDLDLPLVVTWTVRNEPQWLVDQLVENVRGMAMLTGGFRAVEVDNRSQRGGWGHEGEMRQRQRAQIVGEVLRPRGLTRAWVLQLDPDERLEKNAAGELHAALRRFETERQAGELHRCTISFPLREMWTPTAYRIDNGWATKKPRARLFCLDLNARQSFGTKPIHQGIMPRGCGCCPQDAPRWRVRLPVNLYHLKNIEPLNRVARAAAYLSADPTFAHQAREGKDWSWLYDEDGLELETIPPGQGFSPAYDRPYEFIQPS